MHEPDDETNSSESVSSEGEPSVEVAVGDYEDQVQLDESVAEVAVEAYEEQTALEATAAEVAVEAYDETPSIEVETPTGETEADSEADSETDSEADSEASADESRDQSVVQDDSDEDTVQIDLPVVAPSDLEDLHDTFEAGSTHPSESIDDEPLAGDDTEARPGLEKAPPFVLGLAPLKSALESLIFVTDKPLTDRQLADLAHATIPEVRMAAFELQKEYEGRGIELHQVAGGYQFRSSAKNAPFVRALVAPKPVRLSRALLETLSIVAYRQPVTRPEVDDVRGVDSGEALKGLADRDLVRILGRKEEPGRPLLYGTTKHFLEFFGLNSLRDLPTLREYAELTDESRSIFERRMGEPLDLKGVQAQADAAVAEQHAKDLDEGPKDDDLDDEDESDESGESGESKPADAGSNEAASDDEREADEEGGDERPAEDEE